MHEQETSSPPVKIEEVLVNDIPINLKEKLELKQGTRKIEFRYAALSYLSPERTRYRTKLHNFEENWYEAENQNSIYYTNLPPGKYTFQVIAREARGNWNETGASFTFHQKSNFFQTIWFILSCILGAFFIGFGSYRLRVQQLRRQEKHLKDLVKKQTIKLEQANTELERLSTHDDLTSIYNFRWFSQFYQREWNRALRNFNALSIIMIDIDFFKKYNDTYGHIEGDNCLRLVAKALKDSIQRSNDIVARYGGEEFVIVLLDTDKEGTCYVAEKAHNNVKALKIPHKTSSVSQYITLSLGCATVIPRQNMESSILIRAADEALYRSKRKGRNRMTFLDPLKITNSYFFSQDQKKIQDEK